MTKNNIILIDCDGVLLLWRDSFKLYMQHQGHEWLNVKDDYRVAQHFNLSVDEVYQHMKRFNDGHWLFGTLKPIEDAVSGMKTLSKMGYRFIAITSCSSNPTSKVLRQANLYNIFGDVFDDVHCVPIYESKKPHLAEYEPTFWIEDNFKNCVDGIKYGHTGILLTQIWNRIYEDNDIKRCDKWPEIVDFIEENQNINNT